jgi:hypothetical protein
MSFLHKQDLRNWHKERVGLRLTPRQFKSNQAQIKLELFHYRKQHLSYTTSTYILMNISILLPIHRLLLRIQGFRNRIEIILMYYKLVIALCQLRKS